MPTDRSFALLDEQKLKRFHWRAMFTTGMGVFTDGYDLSSIGIVLPLVLASFGIHHLSGMQGAMLAGSALVGAAVGAVIFGFLAQKGRKAYYGYDVLLMAVASFAQIFAPNLTVLIVIRVILGIGIGADYVLSPTIMAEHANRRDRGKTLGLGFGLMWTLGAVGAGLMALLLKLLDVSPDLQWRIVLAAGAIPALSVLYLRRTMPETARFLSRLGGDDAAAQAVVRSVSGHGAALPGRDRRPLGMVIAKHARVIFGTALLWMLFDIVTYSSTLFGPSLIAGQLGLSAVAFSLILNMVFHIPTALLANFFVIDRIGRKPLQIGGFLGAAVMLVIFALMQSSVRADPKLGLLVFGLFTMALVGPNIVGGAGILGVELAPTRVRSIAQGVSVVGGRIGASIAAFLFPLLYNAIGETWTLGVLAAISLLGAIGTATLVPETSGRSLEEINDDRHGAAQAVRAAA